MWSAGEDANEAVQVEGDNDANDGVSDPRWATMSEEQQTTCSAVTALDSGSAGTGDEKPIVVLRSSTWLRESHGLYDYESSDIVRKEDQLPHACTVLRKETHVMIQPPLPGQPACPVEAEPLARLIVRNGKFCVDGTRTLAPSPDGGRKGGKLWRVVKDVAGGHYLQEGDSIKLGRFKLRVRQLVVPSTQAANATPEGVLATVTVSGAGAPRLCRVNAEGVGEENLPCRICLLEDSTQEDPLLRPCECRGTIECVHLACLRHWIRGRLDLQESSTGSYFYKPLACELCKAQYATHMVDGSGEGDPLPIVELPKTQPPFVVLERDSNRPDSKGAHVISLAERKVLKLGRGHESDVRFADVSISRWHADIRFDQRRGAFVLSDHESKFGTLVAMRSPVPCDDKQPLTFQAGRSLLEFKMKGDFSNLAPLSEEAEEDSKVIWAGGTRTHLDGEK